ncbi:Phosphatidate cytidylyltransferase [Stappia aggregata IAM 12614]|uniref:Phosphatidate cytidylyltransferase n=1 Tax=Roseibium aggregatum (strain ATCC 25650 / DSM 13394 / JCM 20685 / NBRC 16684 / NCIMB 2208 / IAM 12614 / B1) TaxID=384765 RepID=A0NT58_ROSAI|nr:phosphatidate cytidylyltransferase [Roseibium aggregatum]EAV44140.1 Phosphatidate cytidylyltransferase [Stappia aggregata IAM 12614] [Roseibium aggregatum IAM 12614]
MAEPDQHPKKLSDLRLRFLSALVLGPLVLLITYLGGLPFAALTLAATGLFLWEWFSITGTPAKTAGALTGFVTLLAIATLCVTGHPGLGLAAMVLGAFIAYAVGGFSKTGRWAIEGIAYSGLALFSLLALREGSEGLLVAFFLVFVVWATDIFAYFTGRALGGPKLWPRVSPKKTWSGAIGGLVLATLFGTGVALVANAQHLVLWALLAAGLSVVSQAGDLLESAIKRRFDVKDSSRLIPGHGGIMDRIDGLVAAAIFAVLIGLLAGGSLADPLAGLGLI